MTAPWFDYVAGSATIAAGVLALAAIALGQRSTNLLRSEALLERRADFELGVLHELARQWRITGLQHLGGHMIVLIRSADAEDLRHLRASMNYMTNEPDRAAWAAQGGVTNPATVEREIQEAIERRLQMRGTARGRWRPRARKNPP